MRNRSLEMSCACAGAPSTGQAEARSNWCKPPMARRKKTCAASKDHELEAKATAMQLGDGRCALRYGLRLQQGARTCALRTLSGPSEQNLLLWAGSVRKAHCTRDPVCSPTPRLGADCSTLSYAHFRVGGPNRSCSDRLAAFGRCRLPQENRSYEFAHQDTIGESASLRKERPRGANLVIKYGTSARDHTR